MENIDNVTLRENGPDGHAYDVDSLLMLINNTDDLIWSVNRNYKVITCNNAFDEKCRHLSGLLRGRDSDFHAIGFADSQLKFFLDCYQRAFAGETFTEVDYVETPVEGWSEVSYYPIRQGETVIGITCYARDVTDRRREEKALKLLESVVTNSTDAVLITEAKAHDESGPRIVYVNDSLIRMTGYSMKELIGRTPRILQGPKSDRAALERLRDCFGSSVPCEIEIVNYKKNGDEFWLNMSIVPVVDNDGQFTHFIAIGRDVSERIKYVNAIKAQNEKLKEIAWIQSHEVRGPLARIQGLINLLKSKSHSIEGDDTIEMINYLRTSAIELDQVIKIIVDKTEEVTPTDL